MKRWLSRWSSPTPTTTTTATSTVPTSAPTSAKTSVAATGTGSDGGQGAAVTAAPPSAISPPPQSADSDGVLGPVGKERRKRGSRDSDGSASSSSMSFRGFMLRASSAPESGAGADKDGKDKESTARSFFARLLASNSTSIQQLKEQQQKEKEQREREREQALVLEQALTAHAPPVLFAPPEPELPAPVVVVMTAGGVGGSVLEAPAVAALKGERRTSHSPRSSLLGHNIALAAADEQLLNAAVAARLLDESNQDFDSAATTPCSVSGMTNNVNDVADSSATSPVPSKPNTPLPLDALATPTPAPANPVQLNRRASMPTISTSTASSTSSTSVVAVAAAAVSEVTKIMRRTSSLHWVNSVPDLDSIAEDSSVASIVPIQPSKSSGSSSPNKNSKNRTSSPLSLPPSPPGTPTRDSPPAVNEDDYGLVVGSNSLATHQDSRFSVGTEATITNLSPIEDNNIVAVTQGDVIVAATAHATEKVSDEPALLVDGGSVEEYEGEGAVSSTSFTSDEDYTGTVSRDEEESTSPTQFRKRSRSSSSEDATVVQDGSDSFDDKEEEFEDQKGSSTTDGKAQHFVSDSRMPVLSPLIEETEETLQSDYKDDFTKDLLESEQNEIEVEHIQEQVQNYVNLDLTNLEQIGTKEILQDEVKSLTVVAVQDIGSPSALSPSTTVITAEQFAALEPQSEEEEPALDEFEKEAITGIVDEMFSSVGASSTIENLAAIATLDDSKNAQLPSTKETGLRVTNPEIFPNDYLDPELVLPPAADTTSVETKTDQVEKTLQALKTRLTFRPTVAMGEKEKLANYVLELARPIFFPPPSASASSSAETINTNSIIPRKSIPVHQKSVLLSRSEFEVVTVCCRLPRHLSYALHKKICTLTPEASKTGVVGWSEFELFVEGIYQRWNPDVEALAFEILKTGGARDKWLVPEDFRVFVEDVLDNNSAFAFLASSPDFQARFTETVIVRLFYSSHFHGRNRLSLRDFRTAQIYKIIADIESATNSLGLNIPPPFSYKDFYVIYCAFWELDKDHDMYLTLHDLERYSDRGISHAALARVIECYGKVPVLPTVEDGSSDTVDAHVSPSTVSMLAKNRIKCFGFKEFVAFIMAVEDKTSVSGLYYWFRVLDIDEDGLVSLLEIETFWEHQYTKVPEQYTVYDFFSLILDLIRPDSNSITLLDLKRNAKAAGLFLDFLLDSRRHMENIRRSADVTFRLNDEVWVTEEDDEDVLASPGADAVNKDANITTSVAQPEILPKRIKLEGWQKFAERRYRLLSGTNTDDEGDDDL
ncbi:Serine/threonine-protein phosphatase 2A regulatory subunit B'' subunit alpha [Physocladia obscura]|uniref:Serine/threonine-protein phosphatase 2A regulatory subunit B'' subunit alpha n=1 Tax=Physocladia obscura TaxID=109957 RepID=A0AAD5XIK7_9FUNG|nr:Serine/threonine-protein phosphatase 2A regulatory subunit B'' subunit alpha [Physocladia obscura]